jgi:hypothetical protein
MNEGKPKSLNQSENNGRRDDFATPSRTLLCVPEIEFKAIAS